MSSVIANHATMAPSAAQAPAPRHLLQIDDTTFRECFDRRPFLIGHRLVGHPLFELPRLMKLARSLPEANVEYNAGDIPVNLAGENSPRNGLSAEETIRRIAECKSWLVLKYVESDPDYQALLHECLGEVARHSESIRPGMCLRQGFIFVTSPGSVTPYHMDPEHNFLLQVRGSKRIRMFDGRDRSILTEAELERHYGGAPRNLVYREELDAKGWTFDLNPGFGLHFPVTAPHYVKNGSEVSISFSITFRTPDIERRSGVHAFNALMRQKGLQPTPVGKRDWLDSLKYFNLRLVRRLQRMLGGRTA